MDSTKKEIFFFTDWYLPGYKAGGPIQSIANLISALEQDFSCTVVCGDRDYLDSQPYPDIRLNDFVYRSKHRILYLSHDQQSYSRIRKLLRATSYEAVVYISGVFSLKFSIIPLLAAKSLGKRTIIAPRGMLASGALSIKPAKKQLYLGLTKLLNTFRNVEFHATSSSERTDIERILKLSEATIALIPNLPGGIHGRVSEDRKKRKNHLKILCVARIAPEKNIHYAIEVLSGANPDVKIEMEFVGSIYDAAYEKKCFDLVQALPSNVQATFSGPLPPDEIKQRISEAHLFFLPTLGENYGHAIVESLLNGLPVLISDKTPWRELEAKGLGADIDLADRTKFLEYIHFVAEMDDHVYRDQYAGIAEKFSSMISIDEIVARYKKLFDGQG
jgi:glycosyltransferase involved in cell wall biosynthesis